MKSLKSRILFVLHIPPPVHGASVVGQLIKESVIINDTYDCRFINLGTSTQIAKIGKSDFFKFIRYISLLFKVLYQLIVFRPELCYLTFTAKGTGFYKDTLTVFIIKLFRIKIVYHFHNKGISTQQDKYLNNLLYKVVFKNSNVILLSRILYADIQKYVSEDKVFYCPNGIPDNSILISNAEDLNNNTDSTRKRKNQTYIEILFLSNLIESKGVYILLEACRLICLKKIPFHCTFVGGEGDISARDFQKRIKDMGLSQTVEYAGKKFGAEKQDILRKSDLFVLPTYYHNECFPLVLLEAMQNSLPVISTFEGAIQDIVVNEQTGFLIPKNNFIELANKLELLITNTKLRDQMGANARTKYEHEFTYEVFESSINSILRSLISN